MTDEQQRVYDALVLNPPLTINEIARATGLSVWIAYDAISNLIDADRVRLNDTNRYKFELTTHEATSE